MENKLNAVQNLIIEHDWPPRWLSDKLKVSLPTIYRWLNGSVDSVRERQIEALADLAGLTVKYSRDRSECEFVKREIPEGLELPHRYVDAVKKRMMWIEGTAGRQRKKPDELFFEGEKLLRQIYDLKVPDRELVFKLVERFSKKDDEAEIELEEFEIPEEETGEPLVKPTKKELDEIDKLIASILGD